MRGKERGVCYWIPGQRSRTRTMRRRERGTTIRHSGVRLTLAAAAASLKAEGRSRSREGDGEPSLPSLPLPPERAAQQGAGSRVAAAAPIRRANDPHVKTQLGETHCYSYTSAMISGQFRAALENNLICKKKWKYNRSTFRLSGFCNEIETSETADRKRNRPFFEFQEDLPQPTSTGDHVHLDGSQEGKVDSDHIL